MSINKSNSLPPFVVKQTSKTMGIHFDPEKETISFTGKSIPADNVIFFEPIMKWLDSFVEDPPANTLVKVKLDYFNTSSSKYFLKIFKKFEMAASNGSDIVIYWIYEQDDWDMRDCGEDYQNILKIPFKLVRISETDELEVEEDDERGF